jgi:hypothetical protein
MNKMKTAVPILILLIAAGCASPKRTFETARAQDSREAYVSYLGEYPNSEYSQQARDRIAELDYQAALKSGTAKSYRSYLQKTPTGKYSEDIRARLTKMEQDEFAKAKEQDTSQAWEAFLKHWPKSGQVAEARRYADAALMKETFAAAKQTGTSEALESFLKKWSQSPLAQEAESLADALSFTAIQKNPTVSLCRAHLARFKQGKHSAEVAQILKPLEAKKRIASASALKIRSDLTSVLQDYPQDEGISTIRDLLAQRNKEAIEQVQATLGGKPERLDAGGIFIEACAWAKIGRHQAFGGDYLGVVASVQPNSKAMHLDNNTFLEYADGSFGREWVIWFPDWEDGDYVISENGTSISAEIEMPGFRKGEAWGRRSRAIALGFGSMLLQDGRMYVTWNMAYANFGKSEGSLDVDASQAPSTRRFLLLFPKATSPVKKVSIGGNEFSIKQ